VRGDDGRALYFSRSPLPYRRRPEPSLPTLKHLGLYGYRKEALALWTSLPPHPLERAESLEQLRALAAGMAMAVLDAASDSIGVDTIEDARRVEEILRKRETEIETRRGIGCSPDVRSQGRASRAAQRSRTLDTGHPEKRLHLSAAASAAAAYKKNPPVLAAASAAAPYEQEISGSFPRR
jgi:hypothetical protein